MAPTGAEVEPDVDTNAPLNNTTAGTGASANGGPGTCVYVNSTTGTCPLGFTIAGVTVNEADVSAPTTHPNSSCVTAAGDPCVTTAPSGMGVRALDGDPANDTEAVRVGPVSQSKDFGGCYGFNAPSTC